MAKNIIVLSDGTGSSSARLFKTNVWRLYQALDLKSGRQVANFDDGVGSSSFKLLAMIGGGFGYGLKRNVLDLYSFLSRNYAAGDQIYAFGFSRGSFTVRAVVGMAARFGVVGSGNEAELRRNAKNAYRAYRAQIETNPYGQFTVRFFRWLRDQWLTLWYRLRGFGPYGRPRFREVPSVRFVGVWDTVDAYGLPIDELTRGVDLWIWPMSFRDLELSLKVKRACHALSIDDERTTFLPVLWTEERRANGGMKKERVFPGMERAGRKARPITNVKQERISQVWFAGVHADIGGGYPDDAVAHVPLEWMMQQAALSGLGFRPNARRELADLANLRGPLHDSRRGLASYYRYGPRKIEHLIHDTIDTDQRVVIDIPKIHHSVFERIVYGTDRYAPIVLPKRYAVVMKDGEIRCGPDSGLSSAIAPNPYENLGQSAARANLQDGLWKLVELRRYAYLLAAFATAYLLLFPFVYGPSPLPTGACVECVLRPWNQAWSWIGPFLGAPVADISPDITTVAGVFSPFTDRIAPLISWLISSVQSLLPEWGWLKSWFQSWSAHPRRFFFGALLLGGFTFWGVILQGRIRAGMRAIWEQTLDQRAWRRPKAATATPDRIADMLASEEYQAWRDWVRWYVLPSVFAFALLFAFGYLVVMLLLCLTGVRN